jgi:GAF domain-containing protein
MTDLRPQSVQVDQKEPYNFTIRYALLGFAFGLLFPLVATAVVVIDHDLTRSVSSLIEVQLTEPLLWIIDTAPIILGLFAAMAGRREDRLRKAALQQQKLVDYLEARVGERTRDLDLAIDIGQRIAQVTDLNELVIDALEMVRSNFDLYYAQIYIFKDNINKLVLQAGTGSIGTVMVNFNRRLSVGPDSLVGLAAMEKQTVVVDDISESEMYQPNLLLSVIGSVMAVPLIANSRVVGVLDLYSDKPAHFRSQFQAALEAIAGQLAIAIEHAILVKDVTETKREFEVQARRLTRSGWQQFMDAIEQGEIHGYVYDLNSISPIHKPLEKEPDSASLIEPIIISGESIGSIQVSGNEEQESSKEEEDLVKAVAQQVARHVENLRLLDQAERYRAESEEATRKLTRDAWAEYTDNPEAENHAFVYDAGMIKPVSAKTLESRITRNSLSHDLSVRGETIGLLQIEQPNDNDGETSRLLAAVADQLSDRLEKLRLSTQTEKALNITEEQARRLTMLNELSQDLAKAETIEDVYDIAARWTNQIVHSDRTSLAILDGSGKNLEILALEGERGISKLGELMSADGTNIGIALREKRVVTVSGDGINGNQDVESFMVAPLIAGGRSIGTLNVGSRKPGGYDAQDESLLLQVASLLASTIDSQQLFSETEKRAEELALINQVAQAVSQQLELDQLLETVFLQIQQAMRVDAFQVGLYDSEAQTMDFPIIYEDGKRGQLSGVALNPNSKRFQVIQKGEGLLLNHPTNASEQTLESVSESGEQAILASIIVPLRVGQRAIGILSVQSHQIDAYQPSDVDLLDGIAGYVTVALENARLFQQVRVRAEQLAVLNEMGQTLTSLASLNSVVRTVHQHTSRLMDVHGFYIALYDEKEDEVDVRIFGEGGLADETAFRRQAGQGATEYLIRTRQPLLIKENVNERMSELGIEVFGKVAESWLGVPMISGDSVIGVIVVQSFSTARAYQEHHRDLLTAVASQAAIAINNAQLFEQVQARARRERILREVTSRVRGTADVDTVMRTAAKEIGLALGRQAFVYIGKNDHDESIAPGEENSNGK